MGQNKGPPDKPNDEPDWHLLLEKLIDMETRLAQMPQAPPSARLSDEKLAVIATSIYQARRRRLQYFDEALFAEPAWDMLLDLFVNKALGRRVSTTSLCLAADVPQSTGLRYIRLLEDKGLVKRVPAPDDGRLILVELTQPGFKQMRRYVVDGIGRFDVPRSD
jgi:DNA-binding MarR family transcriptional regulator